MRVLVLGYVIRAPIGGMAWHYLQYVMGLRDLGHDVYFIEDSDDFPRCYDPSRHVTDEDPTYGLGFARRTFREVGLADRWAYYDAHTSTWQGPRAEDAEGICREADLLLNISGVNPLRPWLMDVPERVFIDTDPVFEQIRQLTVSERRERAAGHTSFFTFGVNLPHGRSRIPDDGLPWRPTRQPVVLDAWSVEPAPEDGRITTVMQWDSYPAREYEGRHYGMKSESFQPYLDLPSRTDAILELALGSESAPREMLRERGWMLRDPLEVTRTPWRYQRYLQESRAELGIAKHGYVAGWSGWFSERSAAYLASGRPVVAQDTGFTDWLDTGQGLLAFRDPEGAVQALQSLEKDYAEHCRAARRLAEEKFDASTVLTELLDGATGPG